MKKMHSTKILLLLGIRSFVVAVAVAVPEPEPYWDDPVNGPNLTCQICEYKYGQCEGTEEEPCNAPVWPCRNGKQMDEVVQVVKARLHALVVVKPPSILSRPKYICIKIEDADAPPSPPEKERYDYVPNMPGSGVGGERRGFVDEFGNQSPQAINMIGRPRMGIDMGMGPPSSQGQEGGGGGIAGGGVGSNGGSETAHVNPYLAAAARAKNQFLRGQTPEQQGAATLSPSCDESTANNEACDPGAAAAAGGGAAQSNLDPNTGELSTTGPKIKLDTKLKLLLCLILVTLSMITINDLTYL